MTLFTWGLNLVMRVCRVRRRSWVCRMRCRNPVCRLRRTRRLVGVADLRWVMLKLLSLLKLHIGRSWRRSLVPPSRLAWRCRNLTRVWRSRRSRNTSTAPKRRAMGPFSSARWRLRFKVVRLCGCVRWRGGTVTLLYLRTGRLIRLVRCRRWGVVLARWVKVGRVLARLSILLSRLRLRFVLTACREVCDLTPGKTR